MTRHMYITNVVAVAMATASAALAYGPPGICDVEVVELPAPTAPPAAQRTVQLAICLDVSGSMSGLIDSARQQLWAVVNELATAQPIPDLNVALLTFGNDGYNPEDGWTKVLTPFTEDLDLVSQQLFALTTNGGTEYVGRVLNQAHQLEWNPSDDALKLVIVAGNESADQDQEMPFREECRKLISRGVMVNSIYCGSESDGIAPAWREVAQLADGQFASIDHNQPIVAVATPFDDQLATLNVALNATYIPIGAAGEAGWANQQEQDANAAAANSTSMAQRIQTKSTTAYRCSWDLIDGCRLGNVKIEEVAVDDLPEEMQSMDEDERAAHVAKLAQEREALQNQIAELNDKYQAFVREEMERQAIDASKTFGSAVSKAVREQATAKGFSFPEPVSPTISSSTAEEEPKDDDC
jgi:hypothetical protein